MIRMALGKLLDLDGRLPRYRGGWVYVVGTGNRAIYLGRTVKSVKTRLRQHVRTGEALGAVINQFWPEASDWWVEMYTLEDCYNLQPEDTPYEERIVSILDAELFMLHQLKPELNVNGNPNVFKDSFHGGGYVVTNISTEAGRWYWLEYRKGPFIEVETVADIEVGVDA